MEHPVDGPPAPRPLRRDAERNRRRILDAAAEVFAERGLGVSLDDIAHHAEVGVGTVYRRFPDKDALIDALFEEQMLAVVALAEEGLAFEDAWEGLEHFIRAALAKQAKNRGLKEMLLGVRAVPLGGCAPQGRDLIEPIVTRLIQRAQEQGSLRADFSPTDMPLVQVMVASVADYARHVDADVWQRLLTVALDGLRADRASYTPMPTGPLDRDELLQVMAGPPGAAG
jgi:AcrR family transcriptional regulator